MDEHQLYDEAKQDFQTVSRPLFEFAESQVRRRDAFLPFGASLDTSGRVSLETAWDGKTRTTATEILPLLHEGLRSNGPDRLRAVAVCEWVKITPEGDSQTDAIKVLVEHANGLAVAFYLPMRKKLLGKWQAGDIMLAGAKPEIGLWSVPPNTPVQRTAKAAADRLSR